jgi:Sulfotransferase domain
MFLKKRKSKVFCIGSGKTGTTSLERALSDLGYKMGDQVRAELLIHDYAKRNWKPIVEYCKKADAFQDVPFSLPFTFQILDYAFPGSKFILSMRNNADEWYQSLIRFHLKVHGGKGAVPTKEDLQKAKYRYNGYAWEVNRIIHNTPDNEPYEKEKVIQFYNELNNAAINYFRFRKNLLIINVKEKNSYQRFCSFLGRKPLYEDFPWLNKTKQD